MSSGKVPSYLSCFEKTNFYIKKYLETILIFIKCNVLCVEQKTLFRLSSRYVAPKLKFTQHHNIYNNWRKMEIFYERVNDFTFYLH